MVAASTTVVIPAFRAAATLRTAAASCGAVAEVIVVLDGPDAESVRALSGLDVLIDADAKPWLIEAQRKPALGGSPLMQRLTGQMLRTIFEMSAGFVLDDNMPAEKIASLAKDRAAMARREAEHEFARKGLFEPLKSG